MTVVDGAALASRLADGPVAALLRREPWMLEGDCRGASTALFVAPVGEPAGARRAREAMALALCASCPVRIACRDYARAHREVGIWGGETDGERRSALLGPRPPRRRRRAPAVAIEPAPDCAPF
jgi:WhiB family redox-sensing transcriptional regulator